MRRNEALKTIPTPSYLFDEDLLDDRVRLVRDAFPSSVSLCYAVKANPFLVGHLSPLVDRIEACSPGELEICRLSHIPMEKVVFSGVAKSRDEIAHAMDAHVGCITVESISQYDAVVSLCEERKENENILLRLTSGNQFGIDAKELVPLLEKGSPCAVEGIQYYSGTQKHAAEMQKEISFLASFCKEHGIKTLEYGPGLPIRYFDTQGKAESDKELLSDLETGLPRDLHVVLEMGRFLVAGCGFYVSSVVDMKKNDGVTYLIIDGGINHVSYYGQIMGMRKPPVSELGPYDPSLPPVPATICGSLCTVSDVLAKGVPFHPAIGNRILFSSIGAYSVTEGIYLFLSRDMPRIYRFTEKNGFAILRDNVETCRLNMPQEGDSHGTIA
jgi:diaminopimelate decarboxylase